MYQVPPVSHVFPFENLIDTQRYAGHTSEGGPLPAYLLVNKFETTPGVYDPHSFGDYSRSTLADHRPDPPTFESEAPRDTSRWSKPRLNVKLYGSRSGADPAAHPEMFFGFLDQDTRTPGDEHFAGWRFTQQQAARRRYLRPTEPQHATHLSEGEPGDIEPETERYKKLNKARAWARKSMRVFSRQIQDDHPRGERPQGPLPSHVGEQTHEKGTTRSGITEMRNQKREEYKPGDEKRGRQGEARRRQESTLRSAQTVARAGQDGDYADPAHQQDPARKVASSRSAATSRALNHTIAGPSEIRPETAIMQDPRGGADLSVLAANMLAAATVTKTRQDMDAASDIGGLVGPKPRRWHLDDGDPLLLLHRETQRDAELQQDILDIASHVSVQSVGPQTAPWSAPHLRTARSVAGLDSGRAWAGELQMATVDDAASSYMMLDATMMKRACDHPQEAALIRRKIITDAAHAQFIEPELANRRADLLLRARSATYARSRTARDMDLADDAMMLHNARMGHVGPASHHQAARAMTDTQLVSLPEHGLSASRRAAPRESRCAGLSAIRAVAGANRAETGADGSERERRPITARFPAVRGPAHVLTEDVEGI